MNKRIVTHLSYEIMGCAIRVHRELGPGLLESIYKHCMLHEMELKGFSVYHEQFIPIFYRGVEMSAKLRADMVVNDLVVVEIKAVETILPIHEAQLHTYMKLLKVPQGLLINFNTENISRSGKPIVNEIFRSLPD